MSEKLSKEEARHELNQLLSDAFDTIVMKRPEAVQAIVIAQYPAKSTGKSPQLYFVACYLERTRSEDALDAILGPKKDKEGNITEPPLGYWEFDYQDGPVTNIQLKTTTKVEYNIKGMLTIRYKGYDFVFNNGGTKDTYKAAISDAFKRCCGDAGFTRKFWQQKTVKVQCTDEAIKLFKYGSPTLKELGGRVDKNEIFLSKSTRLKTLSDEEFLALEEPKELPETISIENKGSEVEMPLSVYFTEKEIQEFMAQDTPQEEIKKELEHRSHFVYSYSPKSPVIFSQLSKMKAQITEKQWEQWKREAKASKFKNEKEPDKQINQIALFALGLEDAKKVLEK